MVEKDIRDALIGQPIENAEDILHSFGKPGFVDEKIDEWSEDLVPYLRELPFYKLFLEGEIN